MKNLLNKTALVAALLLAITVFVTGGYENWRLQDEIVSLAADLAESETAIASSEHVVGSLQLDIDHLRAEAATSAALATTRGRELADYVRAYGDLPVEPEVEPTFAVITDDNGNKIVIELTPSEPAPDPEAYSGVLATATGFWAKAWTDLTADDVIVGMPSAQASN